MNLLLIIFLYFIFLSIFGNFNLSVGSSSFTSGRLICGGGSPHISPPLPTNGLTLVLGLLFTPAPSDTIPGLPHWSGSVLPYLLYRLACLGYARRARRVKT